MPGSGLELVGEHLTEVYHYRPATPKAASHAIVLVPGNPGAVYFYMPFLESLGKSLGGRSSVHGFSFANHHLSRGDAEDDFTNSALGLEQQIAHSAAFIDSVAHELPVNGTITLIGHSIGAYIVLQIISRGPSIMARLAGVIHLMPFVPNLTHSFSRSLHNADLVATLVAKHIAKENSSNPNSRL